MKISVAFSILFVVLQIAGRAQNSPPFPPPPPPASAPHFYIDSISADTIFNFVGLMPHFPGGDKALMQFLQEVTNYPEEYQKKKISGTVIVTFIVDENGDIKDPRILKEVSDAPLFGEEAIRVVKLMPRWEPGKLNNRTVKVQFNLPFRFIY